MSAATLKLGWFRSAVRGLTDRFGRRSQAPRYRPGTHRVHVYRPELFREEVLTTEYDAYALLARTPMPFDVTYVAVPWATLLHRKEVDRLPRLRFQRALTVCQHVKYKSIVPILRAWGVDVLFSTHAGHEEPGIRILPFPIVAANGIESTDSEKDLWYSFVGLDSTSHTRTNVRRRIFDLTHPANAVIVERRDWHFQSSRSGAEQAADKREYQEVLRRSRFSLCPRGFGLGSLRFWESLQAGAIPVLVADGHRLPEGIDWNGCVVRIAERDVESIPQVLGAISEERERAMRRNARVAYAQSSGPNLVRCIRRHVSGSAAAP